MPALVKCQLILQAAEQSLPPNSPPTSNAYPNRVLLSVSTELSPLLALTTIEHQIPTAGSGDCRTLADKILKALGTNWSAENAVYSSGSIERSGEWVPGSGFSFRILKDNQPYERQLSFGTASSCKYLVFVQHLANI